MSGAEDGVVHGNVGLCWRAVHGCVGNVSVLVEEDWCVECVRALTTESYVCSYGLVARVVADDGVEVGAVGLFAV